MFTFSRQKQQISFLDCNGPVARLSHPVAFKAGTYSVLHCGKGQQWEHPYLTPSPPCTRPL